MIFLVNNPIRIKMNTISEILLVFLIILAITLTHNLLDNQEVFNIETVIYT
jgi:hypothetical protein